MLINYTGKNIQITDEMRILTEKKLSKLDKFFDKEVHCNVTLSEFKSNMVVEVTISLPGSFIRAEDLDPDFRTALDKVIDILIRQTRKYKGKLQKKYQGKDTIRIDNIPDFPIDEISPEDDKIVKTKTFSTRPMSEEEAKLQLELVGHNFYVFVNSDTNETNVIYKRKHGGYGILIPN